MSRSAFLVQPKGPLSHHIGQLTQGFLLEPVGGSAPKFSGELKGGTMEKALYQPISLSCPAQGSPVPSYRSVNVVKLFSAEPVGGSAPKFSGELKISTPEKASDEPLSLSCPAQGSPVPSFRSVLKGLTLAEPVGGSTPKFSGKLKSSTVEESFAQPFSLSCPAQGSPVPSFRSVLLQPHFPEPVGGSAPKFSEKSKSSTLFEILGEPFSLSCPAQGSPVPSFRSA